MSNTYAFNLSGGHFGDLILALPAMRPEDHSIIEEAYRPTGLRWPNTVGNRPLDGNKVLSIHCTKKHATTQWLESADREPVRHSLVDAVNKELVVLAPSVNMLGKRWHRWEELAAALDQKATWCFESDSRDRWIELLNSASIVVCPDTGTAHLADALGCPKTIALFGSGHTHFNRYAPYWNRSHCIVRNSMKDITVNDVMEMIHYG